MLTALVATLALTGCVEDVAKDKVQAEVAEARTEAPVATGEKWTVDRERSTIGALGAKITAKHPIAFPDWTGSVTVDEGEVTGIEFVVQMASLESDNPRLTGHLKNEDFFDVPNHPTSTFVSTDIVETGGQHEVTGNLTIRGKTKSVTFPASIELDGDEVKASTEFAIDRQDFGVTYPGKPDDLVQDKVVLNIEFVAKK